MNDAIANEVTKLLDGAPLGMESVVLSFYVAVITTVLLSAAGIFSFEDTEFRKKAKATLIIFALAVAFGIAGTPYAKSRAREEGAKVLELAQSGRLIAEPARDSNGSITKDRVVLRERRIEALFGQQVETSSWQKEINTEDARNVSDYLMRMNQGYIVWNVSQQK